MTRKKKCRKPAPAIIEALEPRILFSADAFSVALDHDNGSDPLAEALEQARQDYDALVAESKLANAQRSALELASEGDDQHVLPSSSEQDDATRELVFVDTDTPDYQQLVDDLTGSTDSTRQFNVILLDNSSDGIAQITAALSRYSELDAVHIISHGEDGAIDLGASQLNQQSLNANSDAIGQWSNAFSANGDLLIYGCNLAATSDGELLVNRLAAITGADVAASDNLTGSTALGGDWDLEYFSGVIETSASLSVEMQQSWAGLLASPDGSEIDINTTTANIQTTIKGFASAESVAMDANGNSIVVWQSELQDGSLTGVYATRFDANGNALDVPGSPGITEFLVNTTTANDQREPTVAMDDAGNYVIVWTGNGTGDSEGIFFRRYDAAGNALDATEQLINTTVSGQQRNPAVAMDADGDFVVAWAGEGTGDTDGIFYRRFDAAGVAQDVAEVRVNTVTDQAQLLPAIAMDDVGNFVISWDSDDDASNSVDNNVYFQQYTAGGSTIGINTQVNTNATTMPELQQNSSIAIDGAGNFTITWESDDDTSNSDDFNIHFKQYNSSGGVLIAETLVNTNTAEDQTYSSVAAADDGRFTITWTSDDDASNSVENNIYVQEYTSAGVKFGPETLVNTTTALDQQASSVAMSSTGEYLVAWNGNGTGDADGIFGQLFMSAGTLIVDTNIDYNNVDVRYGDTSSITALLSDKGTDGLISLREAIDATNNTGGDDTIYFNISGTGVHTIALVEDLEFITDTVTIDATTESDYGSTPLIEIDGNSIVGSTAAFRIVADNTTIKGFSIYGFGDEGIEIFQDLTYGVTSGSNNTIEDNWVGLKADGTTTDGVAGHGILIADLAANNTVRNNVVVASGDSGIQLGLTGGSGSTDGNKIQGNIIGLKADGTSLAGNSTGISVVGGSTNNIIGTDSDTVNDANEGNVISASANSGIYLNGSSSTTVAGNYIGTDVGGTLQKGNGSYGIEINNSDSNTIGGSTADQRNVIVDNANSGISIWNTTTFNNVIQGNYIGVDATGIASLGNYSDGIVIGGGAYNNTIGGDRTAGEGNVISGNIGASVDGIEIYGAGTTGNKVYGNYIGTNSDGTAPLGNGRYGVVLYNGAQNTEIGGVGTGEGNIIAGNTNYGVIIDGANLTNTHNNTIQANIIGLGSDGITIIANAGGVLINQNAYDNTVGGTSTAARNVISGNNGAAVYVANSGTDGNKIQGNYIGTDVGGTLNKGNTANSIDINTGASNNLVGGGIVGAGNTIGFSGNDGITIWGSGTANNTVQGNFVGTDSTGTLDLGNSQNGIIVSGWSTGNLIGGTGANDGNLVFHNNSIGIEVRDTNTVGNTILGNRIYDNTLAGIDLGGDGVTDNDANDADNGNSNDRQNFPVLSQADLASGTLTVSGTLDTNLASTDYHIEFFGNAAGDQDTTNGEGRVFLGSTTITTNGSGDATFAAVELTGVTLSSGDFVTATATVVENAGQVGVSDLLAYGSTSEFAVNFAIANVDPVVTFGGGNVSYVENAAAIFIDATATVSDVDSNNFDGGVLSISATANGSGDDRIRINNEGMGAGQVGMTTGPNEVYYSGALIGTWSGSGAPLAITFNVTADATAVEAVAQNITFENLSDAPSTLTRTIQFQLTDGDGGTSAAITKDINVTAANDSPLLADGNLATTYKNNSNPNGQSVIAIFNSGFVDPDASSSLAGVAVVGNTANAGTEGTWEYSSDGGANWYAIGSVDDATNALALDAATKLRFVPALDYSGSPTELTVRAIDNSYVGAFTTSAGSEARAPIDTTSNGGTTPIEGNTSLLTTSISDEVPSLWLSTSGDDNSSGFGGLASVEDSDILAFSDPNLALGDVTTGTASKVFNIDAFTGDEKLNGLHYVQTSLTLGGTSYASVDVNRGDVIFALEGSATLTSGASSVSVDAKDVVLFSPDTQGDYSSGTFTVLLNDPTGDSIRGVTLIESNTVVGDTTVNAGDFLLVTSGGADKSAQLFQVDDVGDGINTVGSSSILIDGDDLNVGVMLNWYGIHLISNDTTIGGTNLTEGQILITVNGPATVGTNDLVVDQYDIFALNITKTTIGAGVGNGEASASLLLDGSDVLLDSGSEEINAIALAHINTAPTDITASTTAINENINTTGGYNLGALISTDQDIGDTADYSIVGGADAAKFTLGGVGSDELILDDGVLDFESKPSYAVTIRVTDSVGNTYDETLTITVNNLNDAPVATDDHTSLDFDGTDDYVLIADSASLTMTTTMTMEAWIQPDTSANANQMIMNKEGEYEVALFADGSLAWAFGGTDPAWGWINTGYIAADNEWIHIAVSYDNGVVNSYVNGSLVHTYNGSGPIGDAHATLDTLRIGGRENAPAGQYFDGNIDEVRVWNTARTQDEIQANLDANLAGNETGLAGYWKFNEGSGTTANDLTANANHGTLTDGAATGAPLWSAYVTDQDTPYVVLAADGVLANDIDADGDTLTVTKVNGAAIGGEITLLSTAKITMGSAGNFTYDPNGAFDYLDLGESAVDSFTYEISDGNGGTDTAFAYITITGINDAPTAGTIADFSVPEDTATSTIDLKAIFEDDEDTDTDLTYSIQSNSNPGLFDSATINASKIFTLAYAADQNGFADFTLRATDTSGEFVEVSFRVTVDPVNDAPVLSVETGDSVAETLTETNATLSVSDTVTVTDIEMTDLVSSSVLSVVESGDTSGIANATLLAMMGISGDLDATETSEALVWAFNSGAENFNYLQAGETLTLTYTVQVDDGTAQDTQTIVITINGSNDAPVLSVETGDSVAETLTETNTTLSVSDTVTVTDVDLTDLVSSSVLSVVESGNTSGIANATLLAMMGISGDLDATETSEALVWAFNSGAENFNYLQAGETLTLTYTVQVDDGTAQDTQTIVITINGSNDAPVLSVETGDSVAETLTETNTTLSVSDTVTVTDVDLTDLVSSSVLSVVESGNTSGIANATLLAMMGISGDLDATETSEALVWAFNSGAESFDYLQAGETLTLTYTVQVDDGTAQDTQTIVITINGSNDAPVLSVETGDSVAETLTETNTTLSISDTVTVTDVDLTDLVSSSVLSVVESGNTSGIANATLLAMMGISGDLDATETSEALVWAFNSGAESFNYLQAGETLTLTYTVEVDDGTAQDTQTIVITINGSNDAPVLSVETGDSVAETLTETNTTLSISDTVTVTDLDLTDLVSSSVLSVVESGNTSGIANGTLLAMMGITGDLDATETSEALVWAFNSGAESFDYLQAGETLTLTYTVQVDDGTAQDTQTIVITINGSNDAPVLTVETGDSVAENLTETNTTLSVSDTVTVTDVDLTDLVSSSVLSVVESGTTSGIANATLLAMMGISGDLDATETSEALVWAFNSGAESFDYLEAGQTLTLTYTIEVDDGTAQDTQTIVITINGSNDAPVLSIETGDSVAETLTETNTTLSVSDTVTVTDVDLTDLVSSSVLSVVESGNTSGIANATLLAMMGISGDLDATETSEALVWAFNSGAESFNYLQAGETLTLTYTVQVDDGTAQDTQTIVITINGSNDAPVLSVETGDSVAETLTETNTTLSVSDTVTVTDVDLTDLVSSSVLSVVESGNTSGIANATLLAMMGISGDLDATETSEALVWAFNSGAESFDYLQAGETLTLTYTVQVDDGTAQDTQTIVITINGSNDAPVLSVETGDSVAETLTETNTTLSVSDTVTVTDVDLTDLVSSSVLSVVESGTTSGIANATLLAMMGISGDLDATETSEALIWAFNSGAESFDYLEAGQSLTLTYTVQVDDGTAQDTQTIVITINGSNDAPVLSVETGDSVAETLTETNTTLSISDTVTVTDVDLTDLVSSSVLSVVESGTTSGIANSTLLAMMGISGDLDATETSEALVWAFNSGAETFDYLEAGQTLTLTYTVQVDDGTAQDTQTIVITINGSNDAPVLSVETGDSVAETLTETNTTLSVSDTVTVTDVDLTDLVSSSVLSVVESGDTSGIANATLLAMMGISGDLDATETSEALVWAFNSGAENFNYLQAGETLTLTYTVQVDDGTAQDTQTIVITINGSNDAPVLSVETGDSVAETLTETNSTLSISDTVTVTDVDLTDLVSSSVISVVESGDTSGIANATLLAMMGISGDLDATETSEALVWAFNSGAETFDYLKAGQTLTLTYTVQVDDGTAQDTQTIVITINGSSDAPVIGGVDTGAVTEDVDPDSDTLLEVNNALTITDPDASESSFVAETIVGTYGDLVIDAAGNWSYSADNTQVAIQQLDVTEFVTDTFTVTTADGSTHDIVITINGAEDAPTVDNAIPDQSTAEDSVYNYTFDANVFGDADASDTFTYAAQLSGGAALPSWLTFNDATRSFVGVPLNADVGFIDIEVIADDGSSTVSDVFRLTVTNTDDAPTIGGDDTGAVTEDIDPDSDTLLEDSGALTIADPDVGESSFVAETIVGTYGNLVIDSAGNWSYSADNTQAAIQQLDVTESITDTLTVTTADGTTHDIVITINGAEDAPVQGGTNTGTVFEDGTLVASNTLTITDTDTNDNPISYNDQTSIAGSNGYGNFVMSGNTWTYTLNNTHAAVQALDVTESLTDTFTFTATDGSSTQTVTVTIDGAEDAPTVDNAIPNQSATEDAAYSFTFNANSFGDVDTSDTLTYTAQLNGGGALPGWLTFNAGTRTFSGTPLNADVGAISIDVIADDGSSTVTDTFTLTVSNTNDAPVIGGVDTGAVTEDVDPDSDTLLEVNNALTIADPDVGESSFVAETIVGTYGNLVIDSAGNWSYSADNTQAAIQQLDVSEFITDTLTVTTADGTTHNIVITINGAEDAPVLGGTNTGTVFEDGTLVASNTLTITDTDTNDNPISYNDQTSIAGSNGYGNFEMSGNTWTYTLNNSHAAVQALDVTESLTDTFTFTATDGSSTQTVTVTIDGAEDAPTVDNAIPIQSATEDSPYSFTFNANSFGDVDTSDTLTYTAQLNGGGALPGWLTFNAGTRTFSGTPLNADVGTISIDVIADDGSSTVTDTFTLTVNNTDDAPVIGGVDTGAVTEDVDPDSDTLLEVNNALTIADPDVGESSFVAETIVGTYGNLVIDSAGNWSYSADNTQAAIQQLDVTESITDTLTVTTADGTTHDIVITINGAEDAPVQGGTNTGTVFEDGTLVASNTLTITDTDTNDNPISYNDQTSIAGSNGYGNFVMSGNTWTYTLNNTHAAVQALDVTESLTDTFTFTATDGSSTQTVTVTIDGAEDAPTVDNAIPDQSATEDSPYSFTFNANSFGDVDTSDTLTYTAQLNGGGGLPGWLSFDVNTRTFSGTPLNADVGSYNIDVTADDGSSTVTDTFTLTVNNTDDAPVIGGVDTGAVTEDIDPDSDGLLEVNDALTIADPDVGESSFVAETINGTYGDLVIDAVGNWSYSADNTQAAIQQLDVSESITDTLTVTTFDGSTHNIVITINGAEDAPVLGGTSTGTVAEDGTLVASNTLTITDIDSNDNPISYNDQTSIAGDNGYGNFVMSGNTWTYTLANGTNAVQSLDAGQVVTDTYTFTASDGSTQTVTVTINGAEDASVAGGVNTGSVTEDGTLVAGDTLTITDVDTNDNPVNYVDRASTAGDNSFGSFAISGNNWDYTLNNSLVAVQALDAGDTLNDSTTFTATDGTTRTVTVTINGSEDAPTASDASITFDQGATYILNAGSFGFTDIDNGDTLNSITVTALPSAGELKLAGSDVSLNQVINRADIDAGQLTFAATGIESGADYASFDFTVNDGALESASANTLSFSITTLIDPEPEPEPEPDPDPEEEEVTTTPPSEPETAPVVDEATDIPVDPSDEPLAPVDGNPEIGIELPEPLAIEAVVELLNTSDKDDGDLSRSLPKQLDLNNLDITNYTIENLELLQMQSLFNNNDFVNALDKLSFELDRVAAQEQSDYGLGAETRLGIAVSLSAGFVSWALRAGSLLASVFSVMPLWKQLDPLPIVGTKTEKEKELEANTERDESTENQADDPNNPHVRAQKQETKLEKLFRN